MPKVSDEAEYLEPFTMDGGDASKRALALSAALDIRKFEIELYWKRAAYFWTLIAATFAAFFLLHQRTQREDDLLILLVACVGLVLSVAWFLVNRGSKYWQENWERHVDLLEDEVMGPIYKTTLSRDGLTWIDPRDPYPYSVTKVNQLVSLFVTAIWLGLVASSIPDWDPPGGACTGTVLLLALTGTAVVSLLAFTIGTLQHERPRADFDRRT